MKFAMNLTLVFLATMLATVAPANAQLRSQPDRVDTVDGPISTQGAIPPEPLGAPVFDPGPQTPPPGTSYPRGPAIGRPTNLKLSPEAEIDTLRGRLSKSKTDEEREKVKQELKKKMESYFEDDMSARRNKLAELQSRTNATAAALAKRESSKNELIDLQLKAFEFQSSGLGLFNDEQANSSILSPYVFEIVSEGNVQRTVVRQSETKSQIAAAMKKLNDAKNDEQRNQAAGELRVAMSAYFDDDLKLRKAELESVTNGLKKMEASLKKRLDAKDEIIALQIKIVENEAAGLGFFRTNKANGPRPWIPVQKTPTYLPPISTN